MKKKIIIKVTERKISKTLDILSSYPDAHNGKIPIDDNFYSALSFMNKIQVNQTLNAMSSRNLVNLTKPYPYIDGHITLTPHAFVYKLDNKHKKFKFWFPIIISLVSLACSLRHEFLYIFKWLVNLANLVK